MLVGVKIQSWLEVLVSRPRLPSSQPSLGTLSSLQLSTNQNIASAWLRVCLPTLLLHRAGNVYAVCSKIDMVEFGIWGAGLEVPRSSLSSCSPRDVAWVSGTSVVSIGLRGVEAEDSYCHQGVNRRKEGAD